MSRRLRDVLRAFRFLRSHPLTRDHPWHALGRWASWQVGSRLVPGEVAVPLTSSARLLAAPGRTGVTANVFAGLHEFEDMGFLLHFLREHDLFVDLGANVGSYTVLAGGAVGASVVACEPVPVSFDRLRRNVLLNEAEERVELHRVAVGGESGHVTLTSDQDTTNRVVAESNHSGPVVSAPLRRLDDLLAGRAPRLVKVDVEGFEAEVLRGSSSTLAGSSTEPCAWLIEIWDPDPIESSPGQTMAEFGFQVASYDPLTRSLTLVDSPEPGNVLFVRRVDAVRERLASAEPFEVLGRRI